MCSHIPLTDHSNPVNPKQHHNYQWKILSYLLIFNNVHGNKPSSPLNHLRMFTWKYMAYFYLGNLFKRNKANERQKNPCTRRLTMISLCGKAINNRNYLSLFYYCHIFPHRRNGIIIRYLVFQKICCLSYLNIWNNLLNPARKRQMVIRMKVDSNKVICP